MIKLWLLLISMSTACAYAQPMSRSETFGIVQEALRRIAKEQHVGVDPQVAEKLVADMNVFAGNFCWSEGHAFDAACDRIRINPDISTKIIGDYLADVIGDDELVESVASRFAKSIGSSVTLTGWPETIRSEIGVFNVLEDLRTARFRLQTATGLVNIGDHLNTILFNPGTYTLVAELQNGRMRSGQLVIAPHVNVLWAESTLTDPTMLGRIDVPLSSYCTDLSSTSPAQALNPFNWARSVIAEPPKTRLAHRTPTAVQTSIEIKVIDESGSCGTACLSGLSVAFAQAIAVWRSGCAPCDRGSLSVVKVGDNVWLDRRAMQRILALTYRPETELNLDLSKDVEAEMQTYIATPSLTVPTSWIVGYEQVDQNVEVTTVLCNQAAPSGKNWLRAAQGFLCSGFARLEERLNPAIVITTGGTECGPAIEAIACGKPGGEIQLTIQGYAYRIPTFSGTYLLGSQTAPIELDVEPVILHEVGHWFGVPHPESVGIQAPDIMQGTFNSDFTCIRPETLTMLSNAADDRWPFIAKSKLGLRPPIKPTHNRQGTR